MNPVRAFIALGANLGDRSAALEGAADALAWTPGLDVVACSTWIETEPVGGPSGQPRFLNGALELRSRLSAHALLERCQDIERAFGRDRSVGPNGPRTLDLDLLLFGTERHADEHLSVPHPGLEERDFVLAPLCQIAPDLSLPSGRTVRERLRELRAVVGGVD